MVGGVQARATLHSRDYVSGEDIEVSDEPSLLETLPKTGMQIHSEYTLYGHFYFLKQQLAGARRIRFYMEKESGIRAACHAATAPAASLLLCHFTIPRLNQAFACLGLLFNAVS